MIQKNSLFKIVITLIVAININAKTIELSATVISDNEKLITSRFMGFVKNVNVNEGDIVKKGQLLYEIDSTDIDSKKQQHCRQIDAVDKDQKCSNKIEGVSPKYVKHE